VSRGVALITGAAGGIGGAIASELGREGFELILFDQNSCELRVAGCEWRGGVGDVSCEGDVLKLFKSIDRLDVCVNCAGIQPIQSLVETSLQELNAVIAVNLVGTFLVGRESARIMKRQKSGRIINIASELAYCGRANFSAYCATKGAILSLTRSWARELAPEILVNAVAPGPVDTPMITAEQRPHETAGVPLGRMASAEEIAGTVSFLAGQKGAYYTGQCLSPCGGVVMF
jgi:3-oxoacyl-[acyl-carrier protein] reductase